MRVIVVLLLTLATLVFAGAGSFGAAELKPEVASWLASQTNIHSWSADFAQTRSLKALAEPLTASGHVWFDAPNRFRWELGHPAQTIAVRAPQELLILYPRLERAERFPLTSKQTGPWKDALALLEAGFPRSAAELENQYHILSQTVQDGICRLALEPKSMSARRMIPTIEVTFATNGSALKSTELQFADGSSLRNDFKNAVINPQIDKAMFEPQMPSDYKVVEPLKNR